MSEEKYDIRVKAITGYVDEQSYPERDRFVFAYTITVTNNGLMAVTLLRRNWLITDANCKITEVHGDGVVGEQPRIPPSRSYQYTSAAVLETPIGCMQGSYEMLADNGVEFDACIPVFNLSVPNLLN